MFFGSFYNVRDLMSDVGRRALIVDGHPEVWEPNDVPLHVLANTIAGTLSQSEGSKLKAAFINNRTAPLSPDQLSQLSPPAVAAYHILAGDQPDQVQRNLDALSPRMLQLLRQLSPSTVVQQISARIYLLHDRYDGHVPFTESVNFASELARLNHPHSLVKFSIFQHTQVSDTLDIGALLCESPALIGAIHAALQPST